MEPRVFRFEDDSHVVQVFTEVQAVITSESDRGAVLVGADVVNNHLQLLIEKLLPDDMQKKATKSRLLNYPGMLSTFAARTDFARASEMISSNVYDSIQKLRKLRNSVAHSLDSFRLMDHQTELREMAELSDSMAEFISLTARKAVMETVIARLKDATLDGPDGEPVAAFADVSEIVDRISERPDAVAVLQQRAVKLELALIIGFICGMLAAHREIPAAPRDRSAKKSDSAQQA